jgi:hypothetical protein
VCPFPFFEAVVDGSRRFDFFRSLTQVPSNIFVAKVAWPGTYSQFSSALRLLCPVEYLRFSLRSLSYNGSLGRRLSVHWSCSRLRRFDRVSPDPRDHRGVLLPVRASLSPRYERLVLTAVSFLQSEELSSFSRPSVRCSFPPPQRIESI